MPAMPRPALAKLQPAPSDQPSSLDPDACWAALLARDATRDGTFYYSVASTGVYCRPSCAARRPSRANVAFHATCAAAEAAGFRPCKRCKPGEPSQAARNAAAVAHACRTLELAFDTPTLDELAAGACMSPHHFHRIFKSVTGLTPKAYAVACRQRRLRDLLPHSPSVTHAIFDSGFNSSARFYADADKTLGMKPAKFLDGGADAVITYALGRCFLGVILVAATTKGICAILLGDGAAPLIADLSARFPKAAIARGDQAFDHTIAAVVAFVEAPATGLGLPLDIRGTVFQHRVWQALREIPPGETLSYAALAERIGSPQAVRAVAGACAANAIAVAIPCHRIVKSDGSVSGYRWGVARKRALLAREASLKPRKNP
jgi:AraC family transcriptional regulator, regulatory protein of adaptative response / methylated-DNA-[protein]-cysteine methyltransferase